MNIKKSLITIQPILIPSSLSMFTAWQQIIHYTTANNDHYADVRPIINLISQ